jgi:hypothetical protein
VLHDICRGMTTRRDGRRDLPIDRPAPQPYRRGMGGMRRQAGWRRGAIALVAVYVLILQGVLAALSAGLAAQRPPGLPHVLCSPTSQAQPATPDSPAPAPDCCGTGCLSVATALPPVGLNFVRKRLAPPVAIAFVRPNLLRHGHARLAYPLGARAPPIPV